MKATFDKQSLLAAVAPPAGISQTKNTLTAVDGLLFECPPNPKYGDYGTDRDDLCRISAFDLEKGLRTTVECSIFEPGMFVINTQKILQIVRSLPDGEVELEIDEKGHTRISGGFSDFEISAQPGEQFPSMPMFIGDKTYRIPQHRLKRVIDETVFAASQNDSRAAFNGELFKVSGGVLTVIGCDGNKLAASKCLIEPGEGGVAEDNEMIIPSRFLIELTKLLRDTEDEVGIIAARRHVFFRIGEIYFFTRLIETEYINYEKILPKNYATTLTVSRNEFLGACERASIVTEDKLGGSGKSHVKLEIYDGAIIMSSVSSGGSVYEKIPCSIVGEGLTIGFNCRFLLDSLRASPSDCETLSVRLNSPLMGVTIESAEGEPFAISGGDYTEDRDEFMHFVMPIRLNG